MTLSASREYMAGAGSVDSVEPKLIAYLIARFSCNNHTICDEELQVVGENTLSELASPRMRTARSVLLWRRLVSREQ